MNYTLPLADGCTWKFSPADSSAGELLTRLAAVMQLRPAQGDENLCNGSKRELVFVHSDQKKSLSGELPGLVDALRSGQSARCEINARDTDETRLFFRWVSTYLALIGLDAHPRGGALLHGALAFHPGLPAPNGEKGFGVLLTAPSDTGKTTASNRLPPPWVSLSDDVTMIARTADGGYQAHPWPTWSRFHPGGPGGSWDTGHSVRLGAVFFLEQAAQDCAIPLGAGNSAARLVRAMEQASLLLINHLDTPRARKLRLAWLDVASAIASQIPGFILQLSLTGAFWDEMEHSLAVNTNGKDHA